MSATRTLELGTRMTSASSDRATIRSFDRLYDETFQDVLSYCRRRAQSPEDADEAAAEVYLIAWRKFAEVEETAKPVAWLLATARRVLLNQQRSIARRGRLVNRIRQHPQALTAEISKGLEDSADLAAVLASLNRLEPLDQEIVALAAFERLSYEEIGMVVNKRITTVKSRLYRARKQLRLDLDNPGHTASNNKNPTPPRGSEQRRTP
ncbi:MAG: sigma-70 family RNA polymerase sigma factor [Acidimicrobiaceae bacterium]|nr:sigma-70 family RNA polymerase sigma factor [Acidimicrobiaceae bacterium]